MRMVKTTKAAVVDSSDGSGAEGTGLLGFLVGIMLQIPTPAQPEQSVCSGIGPLHAVPRAENKLGRFTGSSCLRVQ